MVPFNLHALWMLASALIALALTAGCGREGANSEANDQSGQRRDIAVPPKPVDGNAIKPKMVMHRQMAGEPDASGWYPALSTEGGFRVSLPGPFNDFTMVAPTTDGAEVRTFTVGTKILNRGSFVAVAFHRADGKLKEGALFKLAEPFRQRGSLKDEHAINIAGMQGMEFRVEDSASAAIIRVFQARTTGYQLIVEGFAPRTLADIEADARQFFDSFVPPPHDGQ